VALWHKAALLKLLQPGESAWDIERQGSPRSNELTGGFYGLPFSTRWKPLLPERHLVQKGQLMRAALPFLQREGLRPRLAGRSVQSLGAQLYDWAYYRAYDGYYLLRWWLRQVAAVFSGRSTS
jgi:hypothetical protein